MNKTFQILISVLLALTLIVTGVIMWILFGPDPNAHQSGPPRNTITIYDSQDNVLIETSSIQEIYSSEYWAYLELTLAEFADIIRQQDSCGEIESRKQMFAENYEIHTYFNKTAFEALTSVDATWKTLCNTAGALTDLKGNLLAIHCTDVSGDQNNYVLARRSPYSSFKALSVYTPAIEKGLINWTTLYKDSPYKQMEKEDGSIQQWPSNATGFYTHYDTTVYDALRKSVNTIAVRCLKDVGIANSIKFLQDNFSIPLVEEDYVLKEYGEEEVIGSIALGYLETGITPLEMAGYYQIFANGGSYTPPKAIRSVQKEDGTYRYTRKDEAKQVVSPGTADLMNKLLRGVLAKGGTGEKARCSNVEIAGKTGTGDNYTDNWFVGVTPEYSLAMWHGKHDSNQADEMFGFVMENLYEAFPEAGRKFITHQNLQQIVYCTRSGNAFSPHCTSIETGYFQSKTVLPQCSTCKK